MPRRSSRARRTSATARAGGACTADPQPANEKGHGYNAGNPNSIQQTASGLWIQLVGGAGLNWPDTQALPALAAESLSLGQHLRAWRRRRLGLVLLVLPLVVVQGLPVPDRLRRRCRAPGNIGVGDIGTLPAASAPACAARQVHRDPDDVAARRAVRRGRRRLLQRRDASASTSTTRTRSWVTSARTATYNCNGAPGRWNTYAEQAYALLVLQRSVGGGCVDIDRDGICDANDDAAGRTAGRPTRRALLRQRTTTAQDRRQRPRARSSRSWAAASAGSAGHPDAMRGRTTATDSVINRDDYDDCKNVFGRQVAEEVSTDPIARGLAARDLIRRVTLRRHPPFSS